MIRALSIITFLVLPACASSRHNTLPGETPHGMVMLCVDNQSEAVGTIRVWVDDFRTHTVSSGRRVCRPIRGTSAGSDLRAESMGGGNRGPVHYVGQIRASAVDCWDWVLRDSGASEVRLVPCSFSEGRR